MDFAFENVWSETRIPAIHCGFPHSLQENAGIEPQIKLQSPSSTSVPIHYLLQHNWP